MATAIADACAVETGLFTSDVLSTFERPTSALTIPVGVLIDGDVRVLFVRVCVPVVVASMLVSAIPCTFVVSDSCAESADAAVASAADRAAFALLVASAAAVLIASASAVSAYVLVATVESISIVIVPDSSL